MIAALFLTIPLLICMGYFFMGSLPLLHRRAGGRQLRAGGPVGVRGGPGGDHKPRTYSAQSIFAAHGSPAQPNRNFRPDRHHRISPGTYWRHGLEFCSTGGRSLGFVPGLSLAAVKLAPINFEGSPMKKPGEIDAVPASALISQKIADLADWRGATLARMRELIRQSDPGVVEEWKWVTPTKPGRPVWSHDGILCTGETYKDKVKLTFAKGASLKDPARLFNASLDGNMRRAIDIQEGEVVDESAFKALIAEAVALNLAGKAKTVKKVKS
jgi:hypothetical protein